jgi:hypothetical protein
MGLKKTEKLAFSISASLPLFCLLFASVLPLAALCLGQGCNVKLHRKGRIGSFVDNKMQNLWSFVIICAPELSG